MTPTIDETLPLFRIGDVGKAKEACGGSHGVTVDREHRFDELGSAPEPSRG